MKSRIVPAWVLLIATPLIAEYLLGSLSIAEIGALPVLCLMYGGGAVFIREVARATKRGWPTIVILGVAYGLIEEAFATQSLFNPHYLGLRLLDYGYLPAFGISGNWTVYVISLHAIWSICVPIGLVEGLFPREGEAPWLGTVGRSIFGGLFVLGLVAVFTFTRRTEHFMASAAQFAIAGVLVVLIVAVALTRKRQRGSEAVSGGHPPRPIIVAVLALALGSAFELTQTLQHLGVPWWGTVLGMAAVEAVGVTYLARAGVRSTWSAAHRYAAAAGALLVYCWWGIHVEMALHGSSGLVAHAFLVILTLITLVAGAARQRAAKPPHRIG
ncbi:MAG TPA: hypothetical protein VHE61_21605 [Opitutaceae bacterium]|nr:hypothetical protein [Opitutaceae bacterium]